MAKRKIKEERKKRKKRFRIILSLIIVMLLLSGLVAGIYFFAKLKEVRFTGTKLYSEQELKPCVINDSYCWNTVYVFLKYRFKKVKELPFIEGMEVHLKGIDRIEVVVREKEMVGYVYIPETGQNAYFDKDGMVVDISSRVLEKPAKVEGFTLKEVEVDKKLPVEDTTVFKRLLSLSNILKKYSMIPKGIQIKPSGDFMLQYETASVLFGDTKQLNEKIVTLKQIMPHIKDQKGLLHMEDWKNKDSNITFEKQN